MFIGLTEPSGRCIAVNFRNIALMQTQIEHPHNTIIMLDSGICREVTETPAEIEQIWLEKGSQPEPKPAEPVATPARPKTITVDELRVGDEIDLGLEEKMRLKGNTHQGNYGFYCTKWLQCFPPKVMERLLARGVQVYRDGKLISGWPVGEVPRLEAVEPLGMFRSSDDIRRIVELEAELAAAKKESSDFQKLLDESNQITLKKMATITNIEKFLTECRNEISRMKDEIRHKDAELAALKSRPQEVPPLDPWRVLATAKLIAERKIQESVDFEYTFWRILKESLWSAGNRSSMPVSAYEVDKLI